MVIISSYDACSNIGDNIKEIYQNAINGVCENFTISDKIINGKNVRFAKINTELPEISNPNFNIRCNRLILHNFKNLKTKIDDLILKYSDELGISYETDFKNKINEN